VTICEKRLGGAGGCDDVQCMHSSCMGYHWASYTRGVSRLDSKTVFYALEREERYLERKRSGRQQ